MLSSNSRTDLTEATDLTVVTGVTVVIAEIVEIAEIVATAATDVLWAVTETAVLCVTADPTADLTDL